MSELKTVKECIDAVCRLAVAIPLKDAVALVNELERMETLMPFTHPTAYLEIRGTLPGHMLGARAFLEFRSELEKLRPREEATS